PRRPRRAGGPSRRSAPGGLLRESRLSYPAQPAMDQPTPLLRWDRALLKLEMFAPTASVWGRAAAGVRGPVGASGNAALALAELSPAAPVALIGAVTHEMREALKIQGARVVPEAPPWQPDPALFARSLG